ncbi:hypothetical protein HOLleu_38449 [Holothuria leucospilota]|uniref:Uncharacterized protein n=1 Tax=Holothuria leucospilota TaxID=206669 RepID=A0A9Q0YED7_HOLLE|nr:hypothetical protein HOLleu_38449 [Holothuria leucospilota]
MELSLQNSMSKQSAQYCVVCTAKQTNGVATSEFHEQTECSDCKVLCSLQCKADNGVITSELHEQTECPGYKILCSLHCKANGVTLQNSMSKKSAQITRYCVVCTAKQANGVITSELYEQTERSDNKVLCSLH